MIKRLTKFVIPMMLCGVLFADEIQTSGMGGVVNYSISFQDLLVKWGVVLGWIFVAAIGFSFGVGISIKVFDLLTKDINEWEEVKNGNWVVGGIIVTLIVMIGLIILRII